MHAFLGWIWRATIAFGPIVLPNCKTCMEKGRVKKHMEKMYLYQREINEKLDST